MTEIKARIKIIIPGSTLMSEKECEEAKAYNIHKLNLQYGTGREKVREQITVATRKAKPAVQSINITKEAYKRMYADDNIPSNPSSREITRSVWGRMSKKERVKAHLNLIAEHLGGKLESYEVFED